MQIESMEGRRLFAVTISEGYPGFYEVQGGSGADVIEISVSMTDETMTLDGVTYSAVSYIYVSGGGGDDTISVLSVDGPGSIGSSLEGDDGSDSLTLNFDGAVWGGAGNDTIYLTDSFRGQVFGEAGNDQIFVSGASVDAEILGGDDNDLIDCTGNDDGVYVRGGNGNDTIYGSAYADQLYGDAGADLLYGGGGSDEFYTDAADEVHEGLPGGSGDEYDGSDGSSGDGDSTDGSNNGGGTLITGIGGLLGGLGNLLGR